MTKVTFIKITKYEAEYLLETFEYLKDVTEDDGIALEYIANSDEIIRACMCNGELEELDGDDISDALSGDAHFDDD